MEMPCFMYKAQLAAVLMLVLLLRGEGSPSAAPSASSSVSCMLPPSISGTSYISKGSKANYTEGEVIVHFCGIAVGFGTVIQHCTREGLWTGPNRNCSDVPPVGVGTAVGLSFATFNGLFVFTVFGRQCLKSSLAYSEEATVRPI